MNTLTKSLAIMLTALQMAACSQSTPINTTQSSSSPVAARQTETNFSMISYNLKGIPPIFESDTYTQNNSARATAFATYLKTRMQQDTAPDVVVLQEVFDPRLLATLTTESSYPYYYTDYTDNYSLTNVTTGQIKAVPSGLLILSKHPIIKSAAYHFPTNLCATEDCYAKKGVLWVKIQKPGVPFPIDIFDTHTQARTLEESVRTQQINSMKNFVSSRADKASVTLFGGDFNFRLHESYQTDDLFISLFNVADSFTSCSQTSDCKVDFQSTRVTEISRLLDHIFYKTNPANAEVKVLQARSSDEKYALSGQMTDLSDHPMIELSYLLRWK